jgi:hypothetical protein
VRVLQEDLYRQTQRTTSRPRRLGDGREARRAAGLEVDEQRDNIYLRDRA